MVLTQQQVNDMAHFAKIGTGNIVLRVHTIHNNEAPTEEAGQEFLRKTHKNKDTYKQTSYNTHGGVHLLGGTPLEKIMLEEIIHLMKLEMLFYHQDLIVLGH